MEAIILAGGLGTRLRSIVTDLPKCMAPVAQKPFLYYILKELEKYHFTHIILSLGYKHEEVKKWIAQSHWPFDISFSIEEEPLGTGGAIKRALTFAREEHSFVLNGDTLFQVNMNDFIDFHCHKKAEISIALKPMEEFDRYGNVVVNSTNRVLSFQEKQYCKEGLINGGIYLLNQHSILTNIESDKFSFEIEILQKMVQAHSFYGFNSEGYFIDIGIPKDYEKANLDFAK
jgi:D-glycero-alpha-D-manno-heptose 1-phosphate guanylyltransferase